MIVYNIDKRSHPIDLSISTTPTVNSVTTSGASSQLSAYNKTFLEYIGCTLTK